MKNIIKNNLLFILAVIFSLFVFSACTTASSGSSEETESGEMDDMDDMDDLDIEAMDYEESEYEGVSRIPNQDGATISILNPEDGATSKFGDQIIVEVAVENFELDNDGSHWHIYIDGSSWGMVMGKNTEQALTGIEPGEHEIAVYMAIGTHEEFKDGDHINITVEE